MSLEGHYSTTDFRNCRFIDTFTNLNGHGLLNDPDIYSVKLAFCDNDFAKLLNVFPNIVKPLCANQIVKHSVEHQIEISGILIFTKPCRLASDHLKIAKLKF